MNKTLKKDSKEVSFNKEGENSVLIESYDDVYTLSNDGAKELYDYLIVKGYKECE
jgi:hypothetical protein